MAEHSDDQELNRLLDKRRKPGGCACEDVNEFTGRCKDCGVQVIKITVVSGAEFTKLLDFLIE